MSLEQASELVDHCHALAILLIEIKTRKDYKEIHVINSDGDVSYLQAQYKEMYDDFYLKIKNTALLEISQK